MKIINIKGIKNIRDIGGEYKGVTVKEGMLIRGRALMHLNDEQKRLLVNKYNIKTIIDLRSSDEQFLDVVDQIKGTNYIAIPIFEREEKGISHNEKENKKKDAFAVYRHLPHMKQLYYNMLHGQSLKNFAKVIQYIITAKDEEFGFYFHCSEGKDRTGIVAAILLMMLGVSRKEIMVDYLTTNKVNNRKAFKYYMAIKYMRFQPIFAVKVGRMFIAKRQYLQVLFDMVDKEYGNEEKFYTEGLGLSLEDIENFKAKLILAKK